MIRHANEVMTVAKLTFQLTEIPEEGSELTGEVLPDELGLLPEEGQVSGPLALSARLVKVGTHVHVEGVIDGTFVRECVRCLRPYEIYTEVPFTAEYQVSDPTGRSLGRSSKDHHQRPNKDSDTEISDQEDDLYLSAGDQVDLAEMLREHIILSTPMQPLCHEQCRGLCPVCGRDRNEQLCGCTEQPQKNPFAVLQERLKRST